MIRRLPLVAIVAGSAAMAQQGSPQVGAPGRDSGADVRSAEGPQAGVSLNLGGVYSFGSDLSDGPGDVAVTRAFAGVAARFPVLEATQLTLGIESEYSWYDFSGATAFAPSGEPWDDVQEIALSLGVQHRVSEQWTVTVGGTIDSSLEIGADFGDSLTYGGAIGAVYSFSEDLSLGLAVGIRSQLEDDVLVLPLPVIDWRINERWRVGSVRDFGVVGLGVTFTPSEKWSFVLSSGVQAREFRLDDEGAAPDGVGRDWRVPIALRAGYTVTPNFVVAVFGGVDVWGELTLDDRNGNEIAEDELEPAAFVGGGVTIRF